MQECIYIVGTQFAFEYFQIYVNITHLFITRLYRLPNIINLKFILSTCYFLNLKFNFVRKEFTMLFSYTDSFIDVLAKSLRQRDNLCGFKDKKYISFKESLMSQYWWVRLVFLFIYFHFTQFVRCYSIFFCKLTEKFDDPIRKSTMKCYLTFCKFTENFGDRISKSIIKWYFQTNFELHLVNYVTMTVK